MQSLRKREQFPSVFRYDAVPGTFLRAMGINKEMVMISVKRMRVVLVAVFCLVLSVSLVAAEEAKPITPFNGKDLTGWKAKGEPAKSKWTVGTATLDPENPGKIKVVAGGSDLINAAGGALDGYSEAKFGDCLIELEVFVPKGSNSGVYVMGEYEVQVYDSFGKEDAKMGGGDMGAIYGAQAPKVNATKAPGQWNKYIIDFRAPKFDAEGKKIKNATFVKVTLNDQVLHENVEMKGPTPGGLTGKEAPEAPIMFQGDHGPVAYRNIKITPVK